MEIPPEVALDIIGTADVGYVYESPVGPIFGIQSFMCNRMLVIEMPVHTLLAMYKARVLRRRIVFELSLRLTREMLGYD